MTVTVRKYPLKDGKRQGLYLDIYHRGVRRRESLNLYLTGKRKGDRKTVKLAELIASKRRLILAEDENAIRTSRRRGGDFLLYAEKIADRKRVNDAGVWRRGLAHFRAYAGPRVSFDRLTTPLLEGFKGHLLEKLKPGSAWTYWRKVVSACRRAMKDGILLRNPASDISFPKPKTHREFLTMEELRRLAATPCSTREVRETFFFACYCGLRWSDLKALTWDQVRETESGFEIVLTQAKTLEPVRIPLAATAADLIKNRPRNGRVFNLPAQQTFDKAVKRWAKAAGIGKTISIHVARHTFATTLLNQGVDLYSVSRLLGHRALETTKGYVQLLDATKRAAVEKLPPLEIAIQGTV